MSNAASAFSSILMSLPLIAVPCLAVFGLPSIGPATAEAETDDVALDLGVTGDLGTSTTLGAAENSASFSPIVDAAGTSSVAEATPFQSASSDQSEFAPTSVRRDAVANAALGLDESTSSPREISSGQTPASSLGSATTETRTETAFHEPAFEDDDHALSSTKRGGTDGGSWEASLEKLNALGIRDFHLTNSDVPGQFYFSCNLPENGRNVTRRFEAEAATPVAAAEDVLQQVLACQAAR